MEKTKKERRGRAAEIERTSNKAEGKCDWIYKYKWYGNILKENVFHNRLFENKKKSD